MDMALDYLISMRWMSIVILIVFIRCFNKVISTANRYIGIKHMIYIRDTNYDEEEVLKHLDFIIKQALDEYTLLNINPKEIYYINSAMENKIIEYLTDTIPDRISPLLLEKLNMIYNPEYTNTYIGYHIYFTVLDYVLAFNLEDAKK